MKKLQFYSSLLTTILAINIFSPILVNANEIPNNNETINENLDIISSRKSDIDFLMKTLESSHPNIYSKNDKSIFQKKISEIELKLKDMNDFEFAVALSELVALVGDSHTSIVFGDLVNSVHMIPISLDVVEEGLVIVAMEEKYKHLLGGILTSINGIPISEIKQRLTPMISYDNDIYLEKQFVSIFYVYEILKYYNIVDSLENISLGININGNVENINVNALDRKSLSNVSVSRLEIPYFETQLDKSKLYFYKVLDNNTLYIQYNSCREDENLPMEVFANQINDILNENDYNKVILDLRYNGGGSDGVIRPLMYLLEEKATQEGLQLYTLIGSRTFSSALINSVMMKEIGSTIVGTPTGGSVDHFGQVSDFELPNSKVRVTYSNKFIELFPLLKSAEKYDVEPFLPDISVEQTLEDYLLGKDSVVNYVLSDKYSSNKETNITRSKLAVELGRHYIEYTGNKMENLDNNFEDVSMFSYIAPYVSWANSNNIMVGENEKIFSPNKYITRAELAVVLCRYAELLGVDLSNINKNFEEILDIKDVDLWEESSVKLLGGSYIFPLENGMFKPNEIVSIEEFNNILNKFKSLLI